MNLSDVSQNEWKAYCKGCELSSIYLDPRWLELIESVYPKLKIHRLVCRDAHNQILWLLPLVEIMPLGRRRPMMISLPFGNYGGFLFPKEKKTGLTENVLAPMVNFFKQSHAFALELRETHLPDHDLQVEDCFKRFEVLFPEDVDVLWKKVITGNARTSVRKANKLGVKAVFDHEQALKIFHRIYELNASYHGTPTHHVRWYEMLADLFRYEIDIILAEYRGRFIGGIFLLHHQGKSILHAAVSNPQYRKMPVTDKLIWASYERIMKTGKSNSYDFGRTRSEPGKIFFKRKWGGVEQPIYYSYLIKPGKKIPRILPENPRLRPAIQAWRCLPMKVKRLIGPSFRVRIPT